METNGVREVRRAPAALRILLVAAVLGALVVASLATASVARAADRATIERSGVTVSFSESERRLAEHVIALVLEIRDELAAEFDRARLETLRVDVATTAGEFAALSYGGVPDWGAGCAIERERRIVLRSPRAAGAPATLRTLVTHELAHLAVYDQLGGVRAPRWFHEGAASAVAVEWRLDESAALALAAWRGSLMALSGLERRFPQNARQARLAYAESYQAVVWLAELRGETTVSGLIDRIRDDGMFERSVGGLTGADARSFDQLFLQRIRERFGLALLLRRGNLLFLGAAVLVLAGAVLRWRRSRRRLAEWEREERSGGGTSEGASGSWR